MAESRGTVAGDSDRMSRFQRGTEALWLGVRRWFAVATAVGAVTGLAVAGIHYVAYELTWGFVRGHLSPATIVLAPAIGLGISGLALRYLTSQPDLHGTEEVIEAVHHSGGRMSVRSFPGKVLAAIATLSSGGSAGLEGPSIYVGASVGSLFERTFRRLGFGRADLRTMAIAGAAAGISAIFKAPVTGIIFALEVPYKDDLAHDALVPALVASVTSYFVFVSLLGAEPLFPHRAEAFPRYEEMVVATFLGLAVGVVARVFVRLYHAVGLAARRWRVALPVRTALGGAVCGLLGLVALLTLGTPDAVLGPGYASIRQLVAGSLSADQAAGLLVLKGAATLATLGSGAAGGIFIPMITLGAACGAVLDRLVPGVSPGLLSTAGMAAFLAAGYNTPLAGAVFVAETTGSSGYAIPALVASAVGYAVAGRVSVSTAQVWRREGRMDAMLASEVKEVMTKDVTTVPPEASLSDLVADFVVAHRRRSFPVVDGGRLVGMVALRDVRAVPRQRWPMTSVSEVMTTDVVSVHADDTLRKAAELMAASEVDRLPVVRRDDRLRLVGIISSTDLVQLEKLGERE